MIVRCAKCRELLDYSEVNHIIVDSCSRGCDAGFQMVQEGTERINCCWYHNNRGPAATNLRDEYSWLRKPTKSEPKITTCWYKESDVWKTGFFHGWSQDFEEFETRQFGSAVIEDAVDSRVRVVYAGYVSFSNDNPDSKEGDAKIPESGDAEVRAICRAIMQREDGVDPDAPLTEEECERYRKYLRPAFKAAVERSERYKEHQAEHDRFHVELKRTKHE